MTEERLIEIEEYRTNWRKWKKPADHDYATAFVMCEKMVPELIAEVRRLQMQSMENAARASQYSTHLSFLKVEANSLRTLLAESIMMITSLFSQTNKCECHVPEFVCGVHSIISRIDAALKEKE